jgi:hypothetical protein
MVGNGIVQISIHLLVGFLSSKRKAPVRKPASVCQGMHLHKSARAAAEASWAEVAHESQSVLVRVKRSGDAQQGKRESGDG